MVKQKMISFKIDNDNLQRLDVLCSQLGVNRNKFINFAVDAAINNLSNFRECALVQAYRLALVEFVH